MFIAKQLDQTTKYYISQVHDLDVQVRMGTNLDQPKLIEASTSLVKFSINENYVMFLASLFEYHFNDVRQLIDIIQQV